MSVAFSSKISHLRKERNLTQRQAAEDLQISQALLSHYENGIRECSLEFAQKAARYYGVSADYLLGLSETEKHSGEALWEDQLPEDGEMSLQTLLRALLRLYDAAGANSERAAQLFLDYFSLAAKSYVDGLRMESPYRRSASELCRQYLLQNGGSARSADLPEENAQPLQTVEAHAAALLETHLPAIISG